METAYYRTGDESWRRITKFWMRIFGINFAAGVATGLILEFEFGTNWSNYPNWRKFINLRREYGKIMDISYASLKLAPSCASHKY
jgi:hypothetical protein